jgi:hypothetical protein
MKCLLATAVLALLVGTPVIGKDPPRDFPVVRMKPGEGLVMLRVIGTREVGGLFPKWGMLALRRVKTGKQQEELHDRYSRGLQSSVFMESIPPGDYEPMFLMSTLPDAFGTNLASADFPEGFRFKVQEGQLTDLGTLYYVRPYAPPQTDHYRFIQAEDGDFARNTQFMLETEQAEKLLASRQGWSSVPAAAQSASLTTRIRHLSLYLAGRTTAPDGTMLFGELFGQVARRSPDGIWTWEETGLPETILGAAETADGNLYAVAEHSTLVHRNAPGKWQRIPVPVPGALPCFAAAEPDGSLFTAWEDRNAITVLSYHPQTESPWKLRIKIPLEPPDIRAVGAMRRCRVLVSQPKWVVVDYGFSPSGTKFGYHVLDREKVIWTPYRHEEFQGDVGLFHDGTLYSLAGWAPGQDFQVSADFGRQWSKRSEVSWSELPVFRNADEGYLLRLDNAPQRYPQKRIYSLWRTADGGRSWARHARTPARTSAFILLPGHDMLFTTFDGMLYASHDDGKTASLERDSSDPAW